MSSDTDQRDRERAAEIKRLLTDPHTLSFLATLWGISLEQATERVGEITKGLRYASKE